MSLLLLFVMFLEKFLFVLIKNLQGQMSDQIQEQQKKKQKSSNKRISLSLFNSMSGIAHLYKWLIRLVYKLRIDMIIYFL